MKDVSYEQFFSTLSGGRRLDILRYLQSSGPKSVLEIAEGTDIEQSAISHNLSKLLSCGCVHLDIQGKRRVYSVNNETIGPLFSLIDQHLEKFCTHTCTDCKSGALCT